MRYLEIYNLSQNQPLETAVRGVCLKLAVDVRNEAVITANHANRLIWANQSVVTNAREMMGPIALNASVQTKWIDRSALAEQERFDDGDIEFICSSNIDRFATG